MPEITDRDQWMAVKVACVSGDIRVRESLMASAAKAIAQARAEGYASGQQRIAELEAEVQRMKSENLKARVQVPLWKGVASAMVQRASRIRCEFGGQHSIADCRCDPHQLGDSVVSMCDELDAALAQKGGE